MKKNKWEWKKLGDVCQINPPKKELQDLDEDTLVSFIPMALVSEQGKIINQEDKPIKDVLKGFTYFREGDVLVAKITPCFENGKRALAKGLKHEIGFGSTEFHVLRPKSAVLAEWLYYAISSLNFRIDGGRNMTGTAGQKRVPKQFLENYQIPVPPLPIQQKIVSILERAESLKQKREQANEETNKIIQNIFYKMFGDPHLNEKGFEILSGKDIFILSSGKFNPTKNLDESYSYPTYGGNGVTGNSKEYLIDFDTIVIGRVGAYCGSVYRTKGKIWITDNAIYLKEILKNVNLDYLLYFFKTQNLNKFSAQSGQPKITQKPLENMKILFPPISLQNQFASIVEKIESIKQKQSKATEEINTLFDALMQKAFKGELVD